YWEGVRSGTCAIRPVTLIETEGFRCRIAAEVPDPIPGSRRRSRADRLALAAAREAIDDAGLGMLERRRAALVVGAVGGGMLEAERWYWQVKRRGGPLRATPQLPPLPPYPHAHGGGTQLPPGGPRGTPLAPLRPRALPPPLPPPPPP